MTLVMKLNSFPVINQTVLFAHKHRENEVHGPGLSNLESIYQRSYIFLEKNNKTAGAAQLNLSTRPQIKTRNIQVLHIRETTHSYYSHQIYLFSSLTHSSTDSPFVMPLASSLSPKAGNFHTQKRHFEAHSVTEE